MVLAISIQGSWGYCDPQWLPGAGIQGVDGPEVSPMVMWDPDGTGPASPVLVIGGAFTTAGDAVANSIVCFDPATSKWSTLGSGVDGEVYALAVVGNTLYAGGYFDSAGGTSVSNIARWDTATASWKPLGNGCDRYVTCLKEHAGKLYVAGDFSLTDASGKLARRVACWDPATSSWSRLGEGFNLVCDTLEFVGDDLYAAGEFMASGTTGLVRMAKWDAANSSWTQNNGTLALDGTGGQLVALNGKLYAFGSFIHAGSVYSPSMACYNPSTLTWGRHSATPSEQPQCRGCVEREDLRWRQHFRRIPRLRFRAGLAAMDPAE